MADAEDGSSGRSRPPRAASGLTRRRAARLAAVQALYQLEIAGGEPETVIDEFCRFRLGQAADEPESGAADRALFADLVRGVVGRRRELDDMIAALLDPDWTVERLEALLRVILRAGAFELSQRTDVPTRVAIDEYVGVAHAFYGDKEVGLVNGLLDRLARELRPEELAGWRNRRP